MHLIDHILQWEKILHLLTCWWDWKSEPLSLTVTSKVSSPNFRWQRGEQDQDASLALKPHCVECVAFGMHSG